MAPIRARGSTATRAAPCYSKRRVTCMRSFTDVARAIATLAAVLAFTSAAASQTATADPVSAIPAQPDSAPAVSSCDTLVKQGVAEAQGGDQAMAERTLRSAIALCPNDAAAYRELAGLRLVQQRWNESIELAERAARLDPADTHAWEILAATRFAASRKVQALDAWNAIAPVTIASIAVDGLRTTPPALVLGAMALNEGEPLTSSRFVRAARRLDDLPTSTQSVLDYTPLEGNRARVAARLNEQRRIPSGWLGWGMAVGLALVTRDIRADMAGLLSAGDLWQPTFRWPKARRRAGLGVAFPTPGHNRGILRVGAHWERQTYRDRVSDLDVQEVRHRAGVGYSDWVTSALRIELGTAFDRINGADYVAAGGGLTTRWRHDLLVTHLRVEHWFPADATATHVTSAEAILDWRSSTAQTGPHWTARIGGMGVSEGAPLALWPGAGSILNRTALLRGRELIYGNVISGDVFGRYLSYGTLERRHPLFTIPFARVALAGFADTAKAWERLEPLGDSRLHVDVGTGLRITRPGDRTEARVDIGVGLRDGAIRLSAGYVAAWGRR